MRILSLDIETSGLNPETCQVIEIGAVVEDTRYNAPLETLPSFHCYILHDLYQGEAFALGMHAKIFHRIATQEKPYAYLRPKQAILNLRFFIEEQLGEEGRCMGDKFSIAGKNYLGFDKLFLDKLGFDDKTYFHRRVLDPAILYWEKEDNQLPSMQECLKRTGSKTEVAHNAVDDARDVIRLLREYRKCKDYWTQNTY